MDSNIVKTLKYIFAYIIMYKRQSLKHWVNYDKEQNASLLSSNVCMLKGRFKTVLK